MKTHLARAVMTTLLMSFCASIVHAQAVDPSTDPAATSGVVAPLAEVQPVPPGQVVSETRVIDPKADEWLRRIEAKSESVKVLQADLRYDRNNGLTGSKQRRFGKLSYRAGPPSQFAVYFDRLLTGRRMQQQHKWYIYDGSWLVERIEDEKIFIKHRVAAPGAHDSDDGDDGEAAGARDPLALGEGPFPVPIGQKRERILKRFNVVVIEPDALGEESAEDNEALANTVRLRLTPRPGHRIDFTTIDLWYDRDTLLPRRVKAVDADSLDEMVVDVIAPKVNGDFDRAVFDTTPPSQRGERGWREEINP